MGGHPRPGGLGSALLRRGKAPAIVGGGELSVGGRVPSGGSPGRTRPERTAVAGDRLERLSYCVSSPQRHLAGYQRVVERDEIWQK